MQKLIRALVLPLPWNLYAIAVGMLASFGGHFIPLLDTFSRPLSAALSWSAFINVTGHIYLITRKKP